MADYYVDTDIATNTGSGTSGDPWGSTGNHIQRAMDLITAGSTGDTIHVKGSAAVNFSGTNLSFATYGTTTREAPLCISGYSTTAFDTGRASINLNGASTFTATSVTGIVLRNLDISGGTGAYQVYMGGDCAVQNCEIDGGAATGGIRLGASSHIIRCDIHNLSGVGLQVDRGLVAFNYIRQSSANEAISPLGAATVLGNLIVISSTGAYGIYTNQDSLNCVGNTIFSSVANTTGGIVLRSAAESCAVLNNYVEGFSGAGGSGFEIESGGAMTIYQTNRWFNCTSGETLTGPAVIDLDNSATTSSGLTNAGSGDYTPTSELKGAGYPSAFLNLAANAQSWDIGAIQAVISGGGGAGAGIYIPSVGRFGVSES